MSIMRNVGLACVLMIILIGVPNAFSLNPQIFYKSVYVYGVDENIGSIVSILNDIMLLDSNIKVINEIKSKNDLTGVDILIYVPDGNNVTNKEVQLVSEWIRLGGKLFLVFAPDSKDSEEDVNVFLESVGSSIRYKYFVSGHRLNYKFQVIGEVSEYNFDPDIYDIEMNIPISSLVYTVKDDFAVGSGGLVFIGDSKVPWILVEYLAAYSDLFTWYYSKIISLAFSVDGISDDPVFKMLFIELLSWGITPYLNPNVYSIGLTLLTGILAVAAYASIKIYK